MINRMRGQVVSNVPIDNGFELSNSLSFVPNYCQLLWFFCFVCGERFVS